MASWLREVHSPSAVQNLFLLIANASIRFGPNVSTTKFPFFEIDISKKHGRFPPAFSIDLSCNSSMRYMRWRFPIARQMG